MHMSGESLLIVLVVGLIAGWLAGQIVQGAGFGLVGDLIIGIIGAFIGDWLLPQLGIHLGAGIVSAIINATIGAVLLLLVVLDHNSERRIRCRRRGAHRKRLSNGKSRRCIVGPIATGYGAAMLHNTSIEYFPAPVIYNSRKPPIMPRFLKKLSMPST